MPETTPQISVIIPAYNAARYLERSVDSVLAQTGLRAPVEIVIVNDCSTDHTAAVMQDLAARHPCVVAVEQLHNQGPAAARNRAIAQARGEWIAVLDADDAYAETRLARLLQAATEHQLDVVADLPVLFDLAADCPAPDAMQLPQSGTVSVLQLSDFLRNDAQTDLDLGLLKPMYHRRLVQAGLLRYPENLRHGEDCALYVSLTRAQKRFGLLREAHYLFSTRVGAVSGARSPGSVTNVDYLSVAYETVRLRQELERDAPLDADLRAVFEERFAKMLRMNRIHGWTCLRRGEWHLLRIWLRQHPRNVLELGKVILRKCAGQRGVPR